jgi:hypothetical protein
VKDGASERCRVAWLDKDGVFTVGKDLRHLAKPAGNNRPGHRQVFEQLGRGSEERTSVRHWNVWRRKNVASV